MIRRVYDAASYSYKTVKESWEKNDGRKRQRNQYARTHQRAIIEQRCTRPADAPESIPFDKRVSLRKGFESLPSQLIGTVCSFQTHIEWGESGDGKVALVKFGSRGIQKIPLNMLIVSE
jgi:hypothetical protein